MFEQEVNQIVYTKTQIPTKILEAFENSKSSYTAVSIFQWEEHCTECAMPQCYSTCDMYESRKDGKCRLFTEGIAPVTGPSHNTEVVKITFKKWGSLMTTGYLEIIDSKLIYAYDLNKKILWGGLITIDYEGEEWQP